MPVDDAPAAAPAPAAAAAPRPEKIAILGGGIGSMMAAFEITNAPDWQQHHDVTIYQLGWRLGGKGASGRNADAHQRIEEHGLHVLLGFYDNAFRVLKQCYDELGRPPGAPLATWRDAFHQHSYVVLMEKAGERWVPWALDFPTNGQEPGTGGVVPSPWSLIQMTLGWLRRLFGESSHLPDEHPSLVAAVAHAAAGIDHHAELVAELARLRDWLHAQHAEGIEADLDLRRAFVTVDLGVAAMKGMIESGVIFPPFDWWKLDDLDFRVWLSKHGAHDVSVNSAYITGMYDLGFSLPGQVGAGTALHGMLRLAWTYKGSVFWKMQAGMGDTIFAPLYEVLRRRGVRFEFFARVDALLPSADGGAVDRIVIGRQATLRAATYEPLVDVKGLPCWPSRPRFEQLVEGEALRASGEDLEDWWTTWKDPAPPRVLRHGVDFDRVVLGCSLGVFPYICAELMKLSKPLRELVAHVGTTQTQAMQLWLRPDLAGLGWTAPSPVLDGYEEPMDTWADMTHLLPREDWPPDATPGHLAYLCSPLPDDEPPPPRDQPGYAQRQRARVKTNALGWLEAHVQPLWPRATRADNPNGLEYGHLVAPGSATAGSDRFDTQYWIATQNPSDRYVLALPGSVGYRLGTKGAGFQNLLLAGDYLRTGLNVGCVEAATMGGMHASRAICGRPKEIVGDST